MRLVLEYSDTDLSLKFAAGKIAVDLLELRIDDPVLKDICSEMEWYLARVELFRQATLCWMWAAASQLPVKIPKELIVLIGKNDI